MAARAMAWCPPVPAAPLQAHKIVARRASLTGRVGAWVLQGGGGEGAARGGGRPGVVGLARVAAATGSASAARRGRWEERYAELEEYRARFGDCNVPARWEENKKLGLWVANQRAAFKKGVMEASRQQRLEGLGLEWDPFAAEWDVRYAELEEYKARFGDCNVPQMWEESRSLGTWVSRQRAAFKKGKLEASRQQRLEGLGLEWDAFVAEWEVRYAELEKYRARAGDCDVPQTWEENRSLCTWVSNQRSAYKKGTLEASRQQRLEGLGLAWDAFAAEWEARYAELEEYKARFGDCNVAQTWEENPPLGAWVNTQRKAYKKGKLEAPRQQRLEGLGLAWDAFAAEWEARYAELGKYRARFGDCDVPQTWEENPPLGAWVNRQRQTYKKGKLEAPRQQRLEGLGFVWEP